MVGDCKSSRMLLSGCDNWNVFLEEIVVAQVTLPEPLTVMACDQIHGLQ